MEASVKEKLRTPFAAVAASFQLADAIPAS
jgi:hypothetical protein